MGEDTALEETHVVTAFLRNRGEVLLLRRSEAVGSYRGAWGGVSGFAEDDPDEQVRVEIAEETDLSADDVALVRSARPVRAPDPDLGREWVVHPYLFACATREISLSEEHDAYEWASPTAILEPGRETVPKLRSAYERVAPTVRSIAADDEHGAASLSIRALEVLRDRAAVLVAEREPAGESGDEAADDAIGSDPETADGMDPEAEWDELAALARRLVEVRPAMAVLRNRVNRTMAVAAGIDGAGRGGDVERDDGIERGGGEESVEPGAEAGPPRADAAAVLEAAIASVERAIEADEATAAVAAERVEGTVATLSRSGTVLDALEEGDPTRVFVAESRPAREGVAVAEELARGDGPPVTLHTDAAAAHVLSRESVDRVVVGADAILPDGAVVNKTGTRPLAIAAAREGIPVSVVAATDKVSTREERTLESGAREAVYDGDESLDVLNPTFDVTPADCVTEYLTERGPLQGDDVEDVAAELRELERWR